MLLGILQPDHVRPELAPLFGEYPDMFISLFKRINAPFQYKVYNVIGDEFPASPSECGAWLITGSRHGAYDDFPWISKLMEFIRECRLFEKPIVGVCFGHQVLAHALGGKAEKSEKGFGVGVRTVSVKSRKDWMQPYLKAFSLLYSHQDQVTLLPPDAEALAGDDFCPNALFSIGRAALGIQGHPEFSAAYEKSIMDSRVERIGKARYEEAVASLQKHTDEKTVGRWIVNFLER